MFKERFFYIKKLFYGAVLTLFSDPIFLFQRVFLELKSNFMPLPKSPFFKKINGILFEFDFSYSPTIKKFYFGTYDPKPVRIIKTFLRKGDVFIDVGANIGYITAVAAGCVGKEGAVHSFEPVPECFQKVRKLAEMNKDYKIVVNPYAIGDRDGKIKIYVSDDDIASSTVISRKEGFKEIIEAPIRRLDDYIIANKIDDLKMIKIDVESFELPVLKGLEKYFLKCRNDGSCPLILCEIHPVILSENHPDWLPLTGTNVQNVFNYMAKFSYYPFDVLKAKKQIFAKEVEKKPLIEVVFKFL